VSPRQSVTWLSSRLLEYPSTYQCKYICLSVCLSVCLAVSTPLQLCPEYPPSPHLTFSATSSPSKSPFLIPSSISPFPLLFPHSLLYFPIPSSISSFPPLFPHSLLYFLIPSSTSSDQFTTGWDRDLDSDLGAEHLAIRSRGGTRKSETRKPPSLRLIELFNLNCSMRYSANGVYRHTNTVIAFYLQVKLLYDIVYAQQPSISTSVEKVSESTGGMRAVVTRGGPLDLGFHHADPHRLKMTVEMYVSFNIKGGMAAFQGDSLCLMMRALGSTESGPVSKLLSGTRTTLESLRVHGVVWSMYVDKEGCLCWTMGGSPGKGGVKGTENTVRSPPGSVCLADAVTSDGEEDRSACVWTHVVAVVDSSSNYEQETSQKGPSTASVTLYINSERAAGGTVQVPPLKDSDLAAPGVLYVCPCLPAGSRMTELRVVRSSLLLSSPFFSALLCFTFVWLDMCGRYLRRCIVTRRQAGRPIPILFYPAYPFLFFHLSLLTQLPPTGLLRITTLPCTSLLCCALLCCAPRRLLTCHSTLLHSVPYLLSPDTTSSL
jgi:hypothetical protein